MTEIRKLRGIGDTRAKIFEKKNISTVEELLYYFPRDYEDRTKIYMTDELSEGMEVCVLLRVFSSVRETRIKKGMTLYTMKACDDGGVMSVVWFNNRFVKGQFQVGDEYIFYGKITRNRGMWEMVNPIFEKADDPKYTGRIMPIYPLSAKLTQRIVQSATEQALEYVENMQDFLPFSVRQEYTLASLPFSLKNIHYPKDMDVYEQAHRRLAFEELYLLQLALLHKKGISKRAIKEPYRDIKCADEFIGSLEFELTGAQKRVIKEISADLTGGSLMMRLVQGDVGSGKTVVAAAAMYIAVKNGYQSVIMAPTEILATQHFETFSKLFEGFGVNIILLTGSTKKKKDIYEKIRLGEADIIVGTHAVIQEGVEYKSLGLVVADEQHRFGVSQRAALANKGKDPHFLVMTATPIPRTLALILYGDLDISILDEMPPGRKPVGTFAVGEEMRERINKFIKKNVEAGSQCYVVCPLVEETQNSDLVNAKGIQTKLSKTFPEYRVGLIHGRMKPKEKEEVMQEFVKGEINILVSTTVIEVGVNVPNSNIMIIENAERFGLSQLHQLRGRVGRGSNQAYCILFSKGDSKITKERMKTMCKSNDGFYISEQDLKLRGPGDFFGTRQHGLPELRAANLFEDMEILKQAQEAARKTLGGELIITENENDKLMKRITEIIPKEVVIN